MKQASEEWKKKKVSNIPKRFCKGCKTTEVSSNGFCSVCMTYAYGFYYADYPEDVISTGVYVSDEEENKEPDPIVYGKFKNGNFVKKRQYQPIPKEKKANYDKRSPAEIQALVSSPEYKRYREKMKRWRKLKG